jgi:hypothetical protein
MAEGRSVLTQINIIAGDLRRSLDFYRQVGMSFPRSLGAGHRALQPPYDAFWGPVTLLSRTRKVSRSVS